MEKDKNVAYLVSIRSGEWEDFSIENIFITKDYEKAEKWTDKFNKIIRDNQERIHNYYKIDEDYIKEMPLWYERIYSNDPVAQMEEIELR